jgi:ectoine hydroxylase
MTPEQILKIPARVLSQQQREDYFTNGYILLERFIGNEWLKKLRDATNELVEESKKVTKSDTIFDLEPDHTAAQPRLRRVSNPPSITLYFGSM